MAVNKIKLPNNTTVDINDARDVIIGDGLENVVALTGAQYDALENKSSTTAYIVTDRNVPLSGSPGGGGGEENVIEAITFNGSAVPVTNKTAAITASIPDPVMTTEFVGSMNRTDVSGSGNLTVKNTSGTFPTVPAGTYVVKTISSSSTSNYTISVSFGGQTYSLSTSDGLINDSRTLTFSSNATWSGSITTVNSSTTLIVKVYSTDAVATTVGLAAVSNDYDDLDNKPTIPTVPTISTNISSDATSDTKITSPKAVKTYVDGIVGDIETLLAAI